MQSVSNNSPIVFKSLIRSLGPRPNAATTIDGSTKYLVSDVRTCLPNSLLQKVFPILAKIHSAIRLKIILYVFRCQEHQPLFHCSSSNRHGLLHILSFQRLSFFQSSGKPIALTSMDGYRFRSSQNLGTNEWFGLTVFSR